MFLEEIKAYNSLLSKAANIQDVFSIIDKIDNELDLVLIAKSLLNDISILKVIEGSSKEISLLNVKIRCIFKRIDELKEKNDDKAVVNLLFATSNAGNVYALDDVKSIDLSYYSEIEECLNDIRNGAELKTFSSTDKRKKNILSYKKGNGKQVRVYAIKVSGNYICVFGVAVKKDNWSKKMSTMLDSRFALVFDEVQEFKDMITAGEGDLISENQKTYNELKTVLNGNEKNPYFEDCKNYLTLYSKNYIKKNNLYFKKGLLHEDELYSFQVASTAQAMAAVYENTYIYKVRSVGSITSERKLRNFEDISYTIKEKFDYILKRYKSGDFIIPYTYGLECIYDYTVSLSENHVLGKKDKIRLLSALQKAYFPLNVYMRGHLKWKQELLRWVFKLPANCVLRIVNLRLKILPSN